MTSPSDGPDQANPMGMPNPFGAPPPMVDPTQLGKEYWDNHLTALGAFIRSQRQLANLSLRDLAERTAVSNPYLSQIERGQHEPSVKVLRSIAAALNISAMTLLAQAGLVDEDDRGDEAEADRAIRADSRLTESQKAALLAVLQTYLDANDAR
jgi:transcriptional regulator with XRE-family HTH domain